MTNDQPNQEKKTFSNFKFLIRHFNFVDAICVIGAVLGLACLAIPGIARVRKPEPVRVGMFAAMSVRRSNTRPIMDTRPIWTSQFSSNLSTIFERTSPATRERVFWNPDELSPSGFEIIEGVPAEELSRVDLALLRQKDCKGLARECATLAKHIETTRDLRDADGNPVEDPVSESIWEDRSRLLRAASNECISAGHSRNSAEEREHSTRELIAMRTEVVRLVDAWNSVVRRGG